MSDDLPQPLDPNFRLELPTFEGPLDLLLHLIRKHELDVLDLPISFITDRYLEYLGLMERLNLDIASEYLVMAATLAHIKSKSLLPAVPNDQDDGQEEQGDPREELIRRLLEYQKYKRAAEELGARSLVGRDVFPRGMAVEEPEEEPPLASTSVFRLLDAFSAVMKRHQGSLAFEVSAERITIQERIAEVLERLREHRSVQFDELFVGLKTTYDVVVTFLALLEMAKARMVRVYQSASDAPLHIEARVLQVDDEGGEKADSRSAEAEERVEDPQQADAGPPEGEPSEGGQPSADMKADLDSEPASGHEGDPSRGE